jgi:tRNA threonylcarbamoyladenosine biosynthesis protein TsaB
MEAFASAHGKPGAGVSTLEALAWKCNIEGAGNNHRLIAPVIDARRGEVYGALYHWSEGNLAAIRPPEVMSPAKWFESLPPDPIAFCGDGILRYGEFVRNPEWSVCKTDLYLASALAELAMLPNREPLSPLYVRRTEAEIVRERQHESLAGSNTKN